MENTITTITLKGVKISNRELFREYFDFTELFSILKKDSYRYKLFLKSMYSAFTYVPIMFFGTNDLRGNARESRTVAMLSNPRKCLDYYPEFYRKSAREGFVYVNADALVVKISKFYEACCYDNKGNLCCENRPMPSEFEKDADITVKRLTENGKRLFSCEGAVELYIYLLLHIQAGILPGESSSYEGLRSDLERICPVDMRTGKKIVMNETAGHEIEPFYTGESKTDGNMDLVCISNPDSENSYQVHISGTVLQQTIAPGGRIYALRKNEEYISFMPRFFMVGETILLLENNRLATLWKGKTDFYETRIEDPVCWAHSNEYGTFIINQDGALDENNAWPEQMPEKPVVGVSAFGLDYCLLLDDGSIISGLKKAGWENLIGISLGLNSGIAINACRTPVLRDGRALPLKKIVAACSSDEHYICLDADGKVYTDSGYKTEKTVYAVSICPKGYVTAEENVLQLVNFQNIVIRRWQDVSTREVAASGKLIAYYDTKSSKILQLEI